MEDPMPVSRRAAIPLHEVVLRASRSSGPGGQHANVTASRVEAVFDVNASRALTEAEKALVRARLGDRVTATAQDSRSQLRNRELALERLRLRLQAALVPPRTRRPTRPSRGAEARRRQIKQHLANRKRGRRERFDAGE
jgi:ribosome-associated protein